MKRLSIFISLVVLLSACGAKEQNIFKGTSENWEITFIDSLSEDGDTKTTGTIRYIGEGKTPDAIDYSIMGDSQGVSEEDSSLSFGKVKFESGPCGSCSLIQITEKVEAEILWNGETENIPLISSKE